MSAYNAVLARNVEDAPGSRSPDSQSVSFSHYTNISAQLPIDPRTGAMVKGGVTEQAEQCLTNVRAILSSIGHVMTDIARITVFVTDIDSVDAVDEVYRSFFPTYVPTRTVAAVAALPHGALVQIEALATNGEGTIPDAPQAGDLIKLINNTADAPSSPLSSQLVAFSHYSNVTAQVGLDPKSGRLVPGGVREQTKQCLENIKAILASIDVPLDDIVRMTIFIRDLSDLPVVDEVYASFFPESAIARAAAYLPARSVLQVSNLPMYALVQMEAVVSHGDGTPPQEVEDRHGIVIRARNTDSAPKMPLSTQSVAFSHYNHLSAQLGIDPETGELADGGVAAEAKQCLANIKAVVESTTHTLDDVVKVNIAVTEISDTAAVDEVYAAFFPERTPARRTIAVSALDGGARIQIDAILANAEGTPPTL